MIRVITILALQAAFGISLGVCIGIALNPLIRAYIFGPRKGDRVFWVVQYESFLVLEPDGEWCAYAKARIEYMDLPYYKRVFAKLPVAPERHDDTAWLED